MLKGHLVTEFRFIKGIGDSLGHRNRCLTMTIPSKAVIPMTLKVISDNHSRLHPQLAILPGAILPSGYV